MKTISARNLLLNLLTFASVSSFAQGVAPFSTELGFKRLDHRSTPAMLVEASKSVFGVRSISEDNVEDIVVWDLTHPKFQKISETIDTTPALDALERIVIQRQISNCRERGNEKECTVFLGIEKGTAFLAGDGKSLWTNAHLVSRWVKLRAALEKKSVSEILKSEVRLPIFLFDQDGKLVFDPFTDSANIKIYPEPTIRSLMTGAWYSEDSDFVGIQLSRVLGQPLRIAARPQKGDRLYRPGFAGCTACASNPNTIDPHLNRDRGPGLNSDGQGLYWSAGAYQDKVSVADFLKFDPSTFFDMDRILFFAADAQVGLSGAPILNEQGGVVGVFAGSKDRIFGTKMNVLSRGVRPPAFDQK